MDAEQGEENMGDAIVPENSNRPTQNDISAILKTSPNANVDAEEGEILPSVKDIDELLKSSNDKSKQAASLEPSDALVIRDEDIKRSATSNEKFVLLDKNVIKDGKVKLRFENPVQGDIQLRLKGAENRSEFPLFPNNQETQRAMIVSDRNIKNGVINHEGNVEPELYDNVVEKKNFRKTMREDLYTQKCLKIRTMTDFWKPLFPKGTVMLAINPKMIHCNYHLFLYILKSFNKSIFQNVEIQSLKGILVKYYNTILSRPGYIDHLSGKWRLENKSFYYEHLRNKTMTIEQIIYDESYQVTETDVLLAAYYMNIPICILYQSKQKIKLTYFKKYNKHPFVYFIKVNHDNSMYLHTLKNDIHFTKDSIHKTLIDAIESQSYVSFVDYLKANIRKFR